MTITQVYTLLDNYPAAIDVYGEALEHSPENAEVLTTLGLLYLRCGPLLDSDLLQHDCYWVWA